MMNKIEYDPKNNRFPFHTKETSVSVCFDDPEGLQELDFVYGKIIERHPNLRAEDFYSKLVGLGELDEKRQVPGLKELVEDLFFNIKSMFMDEEFVHQLHDRWGFGVDKVIETLYAVYGYYFFTGKRTANAIRKILDGYQRQPVH